MVSLLIAIIYMAFISLGLPDSLLGSAWPVMHGELGVPLSYAGIITMIISGGTIVSSLCTTRVVKKFGTGLTTAISVALTALARVGFFLSHSFWLLCVFAIPYGLGAGAVDAALNNYVALHYSSRHMSWLHAFWAVGVTISPNIMGACLTNNLSWNVGYFFVAALQTLLVILLFSTLKLWKKDGDEEETEETKALSVAQALKIKGAPLVMIAFFSFCALEGTAGLWASSYLVEYREISKETAALFASLFYFGEMIGRFLNGFVADKWGDKRMIRLGIIVMLVGIAVILLPVTTDVPALLGIVVLGLGAAPVYPCVIHSTPDNFGRENSQALVGIQMASAYLGTTFMPPAFGLLAQYVHVGLYPVFLGVFAVLMLITTELLNRKLGKNSHAK